MWLYDCPFMCSLVYVQCVALLRRLGLEKKCLPANSQVLIFMQISCLKIQSKAKGARVHTASPALARLITMLQ